MNINEEESAVGNFISGIHIVSCDIAVYVPRPVGCQPVNMLVDTRSVVTLVHQRIEDKSQKNFK